MRTLSPEGLSAYYSSDKRLNGFAYSDCFTALIPPSQRDAHYPVPSLPKSNDTYQGPEY